MFQARTRSSHRFIAVCLEEYQYSYDKNAQIISEDIVNHYPANTALRTNEHRTFTYDALGRLTNAVFSGTRLLKNQTSGQVSQTTTPINKSYTYDKVGNRLTETVNGVTTNHQYNQFNQLMSKTAANGSALSTYVYDANGNQLSETSQAEKVENEYDVLNRLAKTSMKKAVSGTTSLQLVSTTENGYNGNGRRIRKKVTEGSSVKQTDYYYQDGVVSFTRDTTGAKTTQNILGRASNIISTERFQGSYANRFYLYNKDQQGSVMDILDDEGNFVAGYSYDDFGQTTAYGATSFDNEICYTGGVYDASTALYNLNARYYDPTDGRFISQDTYRGRQKDPSTLHLYAYCANNPVNFIDPTGHYAIDQFNCYAYAFGIDNRWMIPGQVDHGGAFLPEKYTSIEIRNWVLKDFGSKARSISNKNKKLKKGEYLIATKVCNDWVPLPMGEAGPCKFISYDFHFRKKDPKTKKWWDKPGPAPIRCLGKKNPGSNWPLETLKYTQRMWNHNATNFLTKDLHYNGKTQYMAYKGKFWTK